MPLAVLGIREYRSPTTGKRLPRGPARPAHRVARRAARSRRRSRSPSPASSSSSAASPSRTSSTLQTDPDRSGSNQDSQTIKDIRTVEEETALAGELGVFVQTDDVFTDENVQFDARLHASSSSTVRTGQRRATQLLTGHRASSRSLSATSSTSPGASRHRADRRRRARRVRRSRPTDIQAVLGQPGRHGCEHRVPRRPGVARGPAPSIVRRRSADDTSTPPEGIDATPSGLAVVGVGLLENLEANRVLLTYLAMLFVFLFLAVRLRSIVRVAAVARAGRDRRRARRRSWRGRSTSS